MTGLDLDAIVAIDVHTHAEVSEDGRATASPTTLHGGVGEATSRPATPRARRSTSSPSTTGNGTWPRSCSPSTPSTRPVIRPIANEDDRPRRAAPP